MANRSDFRRSGSKNILLIENKIRVEIWLKDEINISNSDQFQRTLQWVKLNWQKNQTIYSIWLAYCSSMAYRSITSVISIERFFFRQDICFVIEGSSWSWSGWFNEKLGCRMWWRKVEITRASLFVYHHFLPDSKLVIYSIPTSVLFFVLIPSQHISTDVWLVSLIFIPPMFVIFSIIPYVHLLFSLQISHLPFQSTSLITYFSHVVWH
jgi:hypothetical protein